MTESNQTYYGNNFAMHKSVQLLCGIPETNIILYINYTSMNNKRNAYLLNAYKNSIYQAVPYIDSVKPYDLKQLPLVSILYSGQDWRLLLALKIKTNKRLCSNSIMQESTDLW